MYDSEFSKMREYALRNSMTNGAQVSHRPDWMKFDEGVYFTPDYNESPDLTLKVGDQVEIILERMLPWEYNTVPYQLKDFGPDCNVFREEIPGKGSGSRGSLWRSKRCQILSFVEVNTKGRKGSIKGVFATLAVQHTSPDLDQSIAYLCTHPTELFTDPRTGKTLLFWIDCLKKVED